MSVVNKPLNLPEELAYLTLNIALTHFKKAPAELAIEELKQVLVVARRQQQIETLVLSSAEAGSIVLPEEQVQASLQEIRGRYEEESELLEDLQRNNLTLESLETAVRRSLRVETVMEQIAAKAPEMTLLDAEIYYYNHLDKFQRPEVRLARHILVTINPEYPDNTREEAQKRINLIAKRLSSKPQRFGEQAQKHSECPTAMQEGLLGRLPRGQLYPRLDEALFKMQEGEISSVLESELGFHILLCEKIQAEGRVGLDEAGPKILEKLRVRRQRQFQQQWLAELQKKSQAKSEAAPPVNAEEVAA